MGSNATNISSIIDDMLDRNSNYDEIGKLFTYGLRSKHRDIVAFLDDPEENNRLQHIQSESIRKMKTYMQIVSEDPSENPTIYLEPKGINQNSILGTIVDIIDYKGNEGFEDVGKAIHQGSKAYLRENPLAQEKNFCQFKEYRSIKAELQKLI
jgi:hypothetical protein